MPASEWMTASEAATRLGVSRQTLYAYVSRGRLRAHAQPGRRTRLYRRSDVERLAGVHAAARQPRRVAEKALDWGLPVLTSKLTLIDQGRFFYRGHDAVALADTATLEDVAQLLWDLPGEQAFGATPPTLDATTRAGLRRCAALPQPQRLLAALGLLLQAPLPDGDMAAQAGTLLRRVAVAATLQPPAPGGARAPLHQQLCQAWRLPPSAADALRRALVLCADHELNASSFTARCVAATGAGLDACVLAGLSALSGPRHGGMTARVEALWPTGDERPAAQRRRLQRLIEQRLADRQARGLPRIAGDLVPGFGHPLYPDGDPRAKALLALLLPDPARDRHAALVQELGGQPPALDFALVALRRSLGAPEGAAFVLFALARTVGWIAHALEQRADGQLIRPRAAYGGERPPSAETPMRGRVIRRR